MLRGDSGNAQDRPGRQEDHTGKASDRWCAQPSLGPWNGRQRNTSYVALQLYSGPLQCLGAIGYTGNCRQNWKGQKWSNNQHSTRTQARQPYNTQIEYNKIILRSCKSKLWNWKDGKSRRLVDWWHRTHNGNAANGFLLMSDRHNKHIPVESIQSFIQMFVYFVATLNQIELFQYSLVLCHLEGVLESARDLTDVCEDRQCITQLNMASLLPHSKSAAGTALRALPATLAGWLHVMLSDIGNTEDHCTTYVRNHWIVHRQLKGLL